LKHLLRLAAEWEIIPINPAQGVKSPRVLDGVFGRIHYPDVTNEKALTGSQPISALDA
jgi:hypothetical protein